MHSVNTLFSPFLVRRDQIHMFLFATLRKLCPSCLYTAGGNVMRLLCPVRRIENGKIQILSLKYQIKKYIVILK